MNKILSTLLSARDTKKRWINSIDSSQTPGQRDRVTFLFIFSGKSSVFIGCQGLTRSRIKEENIGFSKKKKKSSLGRMNRKTRRKVVTLTGQKPENIEPWRGRTLQKLNKKVKGVDKTRVMVHGTEFVLSISVRAIWRNPPTKSCRCHTPTPPLCFQPP